MKQNENKYDSTSIIKMGEIDHIRKNRGMYIGDSTTPIRLLEELLDNSLDEVQASYCNKIAIIIDNNTKSFTVIDDGRGIPFNEKLNINEDTPVMIFTSLFTSGKFNKNKEDTAYKISTGMHGVGLSCVYALSDKVEISIFRNGKNANYVLNKDGSSTREVVKIKKDFKVPYSTKVKVYPSEEYFETLVMNVDDIIERLKIAVINYEELKSTLVVDGNKTMVTGNEKELVLDYIGKDVDRWFDIDNYNDKGESVIIKFGWDSIETSNTLKTFSTVNLIKVESGSHINLFLNKLKDTLSDLINKNNLDLTPNDITNWLRVYVNLKIVDTSFEAQTKQKLSKSADISVIDIDKKLDKIVKENKDYFMEVLSRLESYKKSIHNKKLVQINKNNKKRGLSTFTKIRDCSELQGELFICEGKSAGTGLIEMRDPKKHAILPLKGVVPNSTKKNNKLYNNLEIKDIIVALGCGIHPHTNIDNLRYSKIVIAADSDPAGDFITSLLLVFFASNFPELVKQGKIYVCRTPLYGTGHNNKFKPLWNDEEIKEARKNGNTIRRFKGLGEFNSDELAKFTFNSGRQLIKIDWNYNDDDMTNLYSIFSNSKNRRNLVSSDEETEGEDEDE